MKLQPPTSVRLIAVFLLAATVAIAVRTMTIDAQIFSEEVIELRVWQPVEDDGEYWPGELWVSARRAGFRWDSAGTLQAIPLPLYRAAWGYARAARFKYGDFSYAGVELRVWQSAVERESIYVQACGDACPPSLHTVRNGWGPPGMVPLPLDDGRSLTGRYRYGDLTIAVPSGNPGLLADREHLLALRDVLEGGSAELNWSADQQTAEWEGVTLGGEPPRVTGLRLSERGLSGEIWGWLGNLTELTDLWLDGNALTGTLPSKLALLRNLTGVYLAGNDFEGCIPPPLRRASNHDLDTLGLPDCSDPGSLWSRDDSDLFTGSYELTDSHAKGKWQSIVIDVPAMRVVSHSFGDQHSSCHNSDDIFQAMACGHTSPGLVLQYGFFVDTWIVFDLEGSPGEVMERSHYSGCVYDCGAALSSRSSAALVEQLAASVWVNETLSDWKWVWP